MAGDWLKIEVATPDKAEVFSIAEKCKLAPTDALGRLILVWRWFDQHTERGNAPTVTESFVDHVAGVVGFAQAMREEGWITAKGDGVSLPRFDRHNGKTAKSRALTAKRAATHRQRNSNDAGVTGALPREVKRREDKREDKPKTQSSVFAPPGWVPKDAWHGFEAMRIKIRKPMTDRARELIVEELDKLKAQGHNPTGVLEQSTRNDWQDVYPIKAKVGAVPDYSELISRIQD